MRAKKKSNTKRESWFNIRNNKLLVADKSIYVLVVILLGFLRPDTLLISVYFALYFYIYLTKRKIAFYHLYVSSIVAILWVTLANKYYGYNMQVLYFLGLNSYALFGWALGLFAGYIIYSHWEDKIKFSNIASKTLFFSLIYWILLIIVESIAYHLFNIQNLSAAIYPGLPICNCIHAPIWMQISYFILGPLYFIICEFLGLENPHSKK